MTPACSTGYDHRRGGSGHPRRHRLAMPARQMKMQGPFGPVASHQRSDGVAVQPGDQQNDDLAQPSGRQTPPGMVVLAPATIVHT